MAEKINFTQDRIRNLPIPEVGRLDYYDIKVPKLTCRVSYTGSKSFVLLKWTGKSMQRVTLGKFPDISVSDAQKLALTSLSDWGSTMGCGWSCICAAMSLSKALPS